MCLRLTDHNEPRPIGFSRAMQGSGTMRVLLWAVMAVVAQASVVSAQEPPMLMLNTGGHMGLVTDLAFTPDGQQLVSAGHDKVIRVWDLQTGQMVRSLRGQVGSGDEGRIFAMALSPDGRRVAAAGQMTVPGRNRAAHPHLRPCHGRSSAPAHRPHRQDRRARLLPGWHAARVGQPGSHRHLVGCGRRAAAPSPRSPQG